MNKAAVTAKWEHFRTINGITMRVIGLIPKDKMDSRPVKDMRTPKELISHMYTAMRAIAEGTVTGEIKLTDEDETAAVAKLKTHDDVVRYATECWKAADKAIQSLSDAQIAGMVGSPWGQSFPGWVCVNIIYDEHIHHRGQLYTYVRVMGIAPPMMWDFDNNDAEYKPKQTQTV